MGILIGSKDTLLENPGVKFLQSAVLEPNFFWEHPKTVPNEWQFLEMKMKNPMMLQGKGYQWMSVWIMFKPEIEGYMVHTGSLMMREGRLDDSHVSQIVPGPAAAEEKPQVDQLKTGPAQPAAAQ